MPETSSKQVTSETGEIDLFKLFIKTILFFRKHFKTLLISLGIGLFVGIGLYITTKRSYFSAYMVAETSLADEDVFEVVKSIKYSVEKKEYNAIEKKLNISKRDLNRLNDIDIDNVLVTSGWDSDGNPTSLVKSKLFKITISFSGVEENPNIRNQQSFVDSIQNGIVKYINDNPYIKERQEYSKIAISNMIKEIGNQLKKLDTLQKSVIEQKPQGGQVVVENATKQSFSSDILALLERKLRLEESYQLNKPIMIVENFNISTIQKPVISMSRIIVIIFSIFILGIFYAIIKELAPVIQNEFKKK